MHDEWDGRVEYRRIGRPVQLARKGYEPEWKIPSQSGVLPLPGVVFRDNHGSKLI
jgi:hypothetical protein